MVKEAKIYVSKMDLERLTRLIEMTKKRDDNSCGELHRSQLLSAFAPSKSCLQKRFSQSPVVMLKGQRSVVASEQGFNFHLKHF